ncbi:hypothetical protein N7922_05885 [Kosakonia sp. ML.JS2a]|uniref:hypothetical protein n=1 Tax=Kosakonia sp. ML.JS2a TaxID=2980557 RepID=UPI0021D8210D|nr:hypothetical protein [Kosakonia sp. ML.JS2a]UXY12055.1 hypothetical protein N7922_05885 [Kosakonia sp. ML.JS2a]
MAINPLQKEIMIRMADPKLNVSVQYSSFASEPSYRIDEAIEQLYKMGYITAVQSKADSHWIANLITPKGYALLEDTGLI